MTPLPAIGAVIRCHADLGAVLIAAREQGRDSIQSIETVIGWNVVERSAKTATHLRKPASADPLERIEDEYPRLRKIGPLLLKSFRLQGAQFAAPLLKAIDQLVSFYAERGGSLNAPPTAFVRPRWKKLINTEEGFNRTIGVDSGRGPNDTLSELSRIGSLIRRWHHRQQTDDATRS